MNRAAVDQRRGSSSAPERRVLPPEIAPLRDVRDVGLERQLLLGGVAREELIERSAEDPARRLRELRGDDDIAMLAVKRGGFRRVGIKVRDHHGTSGPFGVSVVTAWPVRS
jgi:hypothetical protein